MVADEEKRMAGDRTLDGAVQDQIDDAVARATLSARAIMPAGESKRSCAIRGDMPNDQRRLIAGVSISVKIQSGRDWPLTSAFDRRGSTDSQLQ